MTILSEIGKERDYLIAVRRHLHKNPELSLKEFATATYIEEQLESMGIPYRRIGATGVLGIINGQSQTGKTVLLRADIDALPIEEESEVTFRSQTAGVMHACGHDLHTASLLGAAKVLQHRQNSFHGRVLLVFQQAEEFGHGSRFFLAEKITENVDRAFGLHVSPRFPVGTVAVTRGADAASCDYFKISVRGKGAHISDPEQGIDALYIASLIAVKLKELAATAVKPGEQALIGIGRIASGTAYNIIAESAVIEGTTRAFSAKTQALLKREVIKAAVATAKANGGTAAAKFETFAAPLLNDDSAFDEFYEAAADVVGEDHIVTDPARIVGFGADDFAAYLKDTKGVYAHIGTWDQGRPQTTNPLHSAKFEADERALLIAANLYVNYALKVLKDEPTLKKAEKR